MDDDDFDFDADVLVVGTGSAGFAAALTAAKRGASVVMFERSPQIGGTTALSGGAAWWPNNPSMREQGFEDPREDALRYLARLAYPQYYLPEHETMGLPADKFELLTTFYDRSAEAVTFFEDAGVLKMIADTGLHDLSGGLGIVNYDYAAHLPENKAPTGRHMVTGLGNPTTIEQFAAGAEALGVKVKLDHRVVSVLRNDDSEVIGLEVRTVRGGHRTLLAQARRGVVFGSGGFAHNTALVQRHLPGRVYGSCAASGAEGDFVVIASQLGAQMGNLSSAWWKQVAVEQALRAPAPDGLWMPHGDSMLQVNRHGKRAVNEKAPYHERGQVHSQWSATGREYPNLLMFMIWDDAVAQDPRPWLMRHPVPDPGQTSDFVIAGVTWDELGNNIQARLATIAKHTGGLKLAENFVQNLVATVERFNQFARTGKDEDFQRGESPIEVAWSAPGREGALNPTMAPLAPQGPYYCAILGAGVLDTNGGPTINAKSQVLDVQGKPIPGLYGAGNCIASPAGQAYWGPGTTIGQAITFGYIAGRNVTDEPLKKS